MSGLVAEEISCVDRKKCDWSACGFSPYNILMGVKTKLENYTQLTKTLCAPVWKHEQLSYFSTPFHSFHLCVCVCVCYCKKP